MPLFVHDQIQFHFDEAGEGVPFVFQHGLGGDVTQPFGLFRPPAGIRLLAFDARAHGRTTPMGPPEKLCFRVFGEDLQAFLEQVGVDRVIMGGISMGAALALHFTLRWPERVMGLVLSRPAWLEAPCPWNVRMFTRIAALLRDYGPEAGLVEFKKSPEYAEALAKWPDVAKSLATQFQAKDVTERAPRLEQIIRDRPHPERAGWASVRVPTLVLGNRLDPIHPFEYAEELARVIPGAQFRELTSKSVDVEQHGRDVQRALDEFFQANGW
jgi:pimeloyl-ACP methyl ester carboxylesterase